MNLTRELVVTEKKSNSHFSKIASNYKELRTTDADHIKYIKNCLGKESEITMGIPNEVMNTILKPRV